MKKNIVCIPGILLLLSLSVSCIAQVKTVSNVKAVSSKKGMESKKTMTWTTKSTAAHELAGRGASHFMNKEESF